MPELEEINLNGEIYVKKSSIENAAPSFDEDDEKHPYCIVSCTKLYIKSEADKVIADLKKACNDKDDWCLHTLKELRHNKYKRCFAMFDKCQVRVAHCQLLERYEQRNWWRKWMFKWLELAYKLKE